MKEFKISNAITNRSNLSLNLYLSEVNKIPMITPEREVELAQRIRKGDEKALEELVLANLRFVVSVAKDYQFSEMPLEDLIEEGNSGLIRAANMFDETMGFKFISYAVWWIRQSIHQAIANSGKTIRLPANKNAILSKIQSFTREFYQQNEREPSPAEVAEALSLTEEQTATVMNYNGRCTSLSTPLGDDSDSSTLEEHIPSTVDSTDSTMERESLQADIIAVLKTLSPRECRIEMMVFGIGQPACSTADVAFKLNLTRERVRQVHEKSLKKLRNNPAVFTLLQKYLGS